MNGIVAPSGVNLVKVMAAAETQTARNRCPATAVIRRERQASVSPWSKRGRLRAEGVTAGRDRQPASPERTDEA